MYETPVEYDNRVRFRRPPVPVDTSIIGKPMTPTVNVVERSPVSVFARAVKDDSEIYQRPDKAQEAGFDNIPLPPTFGFSFSQWGNFPELQPADTSDGDNPIMTTIGALMKSGGLILHGEQEFIYHAPIVVGDQLEGAGKISDIYEKTSSSGSTMTFVASETEYRNQRGELALTSIMTLVHKA